MTDPPESASSVTRRLTGTTTATFAAITFGILFALMGLFAASTPIGSSPDEPVHVVRAAGVVHGDLGGAMTETPSPGPGQANVVVYDVAVPRSYAEVLTQADCYAFRPTVPADCSPTLPADRTTTDASTYVGSYPPLYYALVGLPSLVLPADPGVLAMRLASAALAAALFALGFVAARRIGGGRLVAVMAVAVTPMAVYLGGTVNPSGVEIAAGFATWLTAIDLLRDRAFAPDRSVVWCCTAATASLLVVRPSGLLVAAVIAVTLLVALGRRATLHRLAGDRTVRVATFILVGVGVLAGGWIAYAHALGTFVGVPIPELTTTDAIRHALTNDVDLFRQAVGVFGWLDTPLPDLFWWIWGALAIGVVLAGFVAGEARLRIGIGVAVVLGVIAPPLTQVRYAARYGYIWSGRYSFPFAIGVLALAGLAIIRSGRPPTTEVDGPSHDRAAERTPLATALSIGLGAFVAVALTAAYVVLMQRFGTGTDSAPFDYLDDAAWRPPIDPLVTTLATALVAASWGTWIALNGTAGHRRAAPIARAASTPTR